MTNSIEIPVKIKDMSGHAYLIGDFTDEEVEKLKKLISEQGPLSERIQIIDKEIKYIPPKISSLRIESVNGHAHTTRIYLDGKYQPYIKRLVLTIEAGKMNEVEITQHKPVDIKTPVTVKGDYVTKECPLYEDNIEGE